MELEGRLIFLRRGTKSQTVLICDANRRRGDYDWIVRVPGPDVVTQSDVEAQTTIRGLIEWLQIHKGGELEKEPNTPSDAEPPVPPLPPPPPADDPWIEQAIGLVEQAIDQLVFEFLRAPYLHRVEHSLHARLFAILAAQPHFSREFSLADGKTVTQAIHKEWPETVADANTRRGNFDLAILSPGLIAAATVLDFARGNIAAPIVIEMGLNYGSAHLTQDAEKLIQSRVRHGYLVHFTRRGREATAEARVLDPGGAIPVLAAYANTWGQACYKRVRGTAIVNVAS